MAKKRLTKTYVRNLSPAEIGKMQAPELRELLRGMRNLFTQQDKIFQKYEEKIFSPARQSMKEYYNKSGKPDTVDMSINQMRSEAFKLQDFFQQKTSTLPGARAVEIAEDKRLFGEDKRGRAKYRMNVKERTSMWALVEEYKRLNKAEMFESDIIQQAVASMVIDASKNRSYNGREINLEINALNMEEITRRIGILREQNWENEAYADSDYDVFSGTRPY